MNQDDLEQMIFTLKLMSERIDAARRKTGCTRTVREGQELLDLARQKFLNAWEAQKEVSDPKQSDN